MISVILIAAVLVTATVAVHCVGLALVMRLLMKSHSNPPTRLWPMTFLMIRITSLMIVTSLVEIVGWGLFYLWQGGLPDAESSFYFSGITYTSIGYGDVVLAEPWRMLGPVEGLTGILMCGLSAGLFFAVVTRIYRARVETDRN